MPYNAKQSGPREPLADEFTALLREVAAMTMIEKSASLTAKFNRIYTALSREDERHE